MINSELKAIGICALQVQVKFCNIYDASWESTIFQTGLVLSATYAAHPQDHPAQSILSNQGTYHLLVSLDATDCHSLRQSAGTEWQVAHLEMLLIVETHNVCAAGARVHSPGK